MRSCLNVSQKNNLVIIKINKEAKYEDIILQMRRKVLQLEKIYKEEKTPIMITGKVLKNKEINEIEKIIKEKLSVKVDFDMPKELGLSNIKRTFTQEVSTSEATFHRGSIRSGQKIEDEGSIVIIGDVNSGAEVIAADNIIVLGALRGLAHAGAKGNAKAIVACGRLDAVQVRIANVVKEIDKDEEQPYLNTYIYIDESGNIVIE